MTIVVSDTTPLNYLILIGAVHVLRSQFSKVFIPRAVFEEMQHEKALGIVSDWVGNLPEWAEIAEAAHVDDALNLGVGEKEAIALAKEKGAPILIDERKGRNVAIDLGLAPISTLNVLEEAAVAGLIEIDDALGLTPGRYLMYHRILRNFR